MGEEEQEEESCPDSKTAKALVGASYRLRNTVLLGFSVYPQ